MASGVDRPDQARPALDRFCVWCGAEFLVDARFCSGCGRSIADSTRIPHRLPPQWTGSDRVGDVATETANFAPTIPSSDGAVPKTPRRSIRQVLASRWVLVVAACLALLLVMGIVGTAIFRGLRDRPIREALDVTQAVFVPGIKRLESASDLERVSAVGQHFRAGLASMQASERSLAAADSNLGRTGHEVAVAQLAFATAAAELADVNTEDFTWWGPLHTNLEEAAALVASAKRALAGQDQELSRKVPSADPGLTRLESVIGGEVADTAEDRLMGLFDDLRSASLTSEIQNVATTATLETDAVVASLSSMRNGSAEKRRLEAYSAVFTGVAALSALDADHLDSWERSRSSLSTALQSTAAFIEVGDSRDALENVDVIVDRGRSALADWKVRYNRAVGDRSEDRRELQDYRSTMNGHLREYSALRSDLARWVEKVDSNVYVSYAEGYEVLSQAQFDRQRVRDQISALDAPGAVRDEHENLITVLDDGIRAVRAAYDGTWEADYCISTCYYRDTAGWRRFSAESARITRDYQASNSEWAAGVAEADRSVQQRPLPRKPVI